MFRESFKYYKSRNPAPDLNDVIDLENPDCIRVRNYIINICAFHIAYKYYFQVKNIKAHIIDEEIENNFGLKSVAKWKIYELLDIPGRYK